MRDIVVVGASLAGFRTIEALRRHGFEGRITAIGDEPHVPYDRPPLTKQLLRGEWERDRIELRAIGSDDLEVDWRLGCRADALDPAVRKVTLASGESVAYDGLVVATGARARPLPRALAPEPLSGVHLLRSLDDCLALREELATSPRVAVVGAGFIGMEIAASCRELGLEVTVVEALETPLVRGLGPELGAHVGRVFEDRGVVLRCGTGLERLEGGQRVEGLALVDGTRVAADVVVVGIGAAPATDWLEGSGLELDDGVVCDETCAAGAPGVVAVGDVARWRDAAGVSHRAEHWTHAVEQSGHAAKRLLEGASVGAYRHVPYVWTDQFDLRIQIAGEVRAGDEMHLRYGTPEEGRFLALFGRDGRLTGAVGFRRPRQLNEARERIGEGAALAEVLAETE